jgi:hypothetical protein
MDLIATIRDRAPYSAVSYLESRTIKDDSTGHVRQVMWRVGTGIVKLYQDGKLIKTWDFKDEIIPTKSAKQIYEQVCSTLDGGLKCG